MKDYTEQFIKMIKTSENLISSAADFLSEWEETEDESHRLSDICAWLRGIQYGIYLVRSEKLLDKSGDNK